MLAHNLLEKTRELLRARPANLSYEDIAKELTEDGKEKLFVSVRWLEMMASESEINPRYKQLLKLYDYLSEKIGSLVA